MKKQGYISIHRPFQSLPLALFLSAALPLTLALSLPVAVSDFNSSMRLHRPVARIMWFIIFPLHRQQNYWSMLSAVWSKAACVGGCECAPSPTVTDFKLDAFLTKSWWFSSKTTRHIIWKCRCLFLGTQTPTLQPQALTHTPGVGFVVAVFVRRVMDHPGEWIYP